MIRSILVTASLMIGCTADSPSAPPATAPAAAWSQAIDAYVEPYVDMAAFDGIVLIADEGGIVYEKAFGLADYAFEVPFGPDTRFRIASLSKSMTVAAVARLIDRGRLTLDTALASFFPDFPGAREITIGMLIDHRAGIAHTNRLDWMDMGEGMELDEIVSRLGAEPLTFEPGSDSSYSNGGYALLAAVLERVSGQTYAELIASEFGEAYPSIGHEAAWELVPRMASRYAPGPVWGERALATPYVNANRIGGGSLYAAPRDLLRFFEDFHGGRLMSRELGERLAPVPADGDLLITGRSPGALAQIYLNIDESITVLTMSSNSGWPGSFNTDITSLYRGDDTAAELTSFALAEDPFAGAADRIGRFSARRFGWEVEIARGTENLVFVQDELKTAFARTTDGEYHLPVYDWLCRYDDPAGGFTCRQRDPKAEIRFVFEPA